MIQGPKTRLNWPTGLAVSPKRGELYVANDMEDSILVFSASAKGDVAPLRVLKGPKTLIKNPTGIFFDEMNDELWVASFGNHTATVHKVTASGDTPPLRVIRSSPLGKPFLGLANPHPVAYDTKREEILVPNGVAHPQIAVFARLADGAAARTRSIEGQKTLLGRNTHAVAYDEIHDEILVPQRLAQAVLTFRGGANGEEPPIRVLQGSLTQLQDPDRLGLDPVNNELYVPQTDRVLVFPREAHGNVAPIRVLGGSNSQLGANALAVDPVHDPLIVAGRERSGPDSTRILIFNRTDKGNVKPRAVVRAPKSGLTGLGGQIAVYPPKGAILVPVRGPSDNDLASDTDFFGVWSIQDNGDVPPRWTIGGPKGSLVHVHGVALDPKNKSVIITDKRLNAVLTFSFPEIF